MEDNPNTQDRFMLKKIEGRCLHWGDGEIKALLSHRFGFGGPGVSNIFNMCVEFVVGFHPQLLLEFSSGLGSVSVLP